MVGLFFEKGEARSKKLEARSEYKEREAGSLDPASLFTSASINNCISFSLLASSLWHFVTH